MCIVLGMGLEAEMPPQLCVIFDFPSCKLEESNQDPQLNSFLLSRPSRSWRGIQIFGWGVSSPWTGSNGDHSFLFSGWCLVKSPWRRMRSCLQSELNFLEREANDPRAYECHYLSPISNPDSRARLSLSCRTGQLSSQRAEPSYFPLLGFPMATRAPTAMATGAVENLTLKCGLELAAFMAGTVFSWRLFPPLDFAHWSQDSRDQNQRLWGHVV